MKTIEYGSDSFAVWMGELEQRRIDESGAARAVADSVIADVREHGDHAVAESLKRFDGRAIAAGEILSFVEGSTDIARSLQLAIDEAILRVEAFHRAQLPAGYVLESDGSLFEHRVRPIRRVGVYVPGGRAVYLSTLIMCAVPARIAGVGEIVVATPPRAADTPELRYVCSRLGIREVYRSGGPAGVAALALGTATLRRVDKIVGPGNAWVTAAKHALSMTVGIDMTAGPTEVVIIADGSSDPALVAADLLAQAEHGDDSTAICVSTSASFDAGLLVEIRKQLDGVPNDSAAHHSIREHGAIVRVGDLREAVEVTNLVAPEHVSVQADLSRIDLDSIENCGAVFVGTLAPVALGDYILGPNHVLPTGGAARFSSPLGVYDFVKRSNRVTVSGSTSENVSGMGSALARFEGLPLHGDSIDARERVPVGGGSST